LQAAAGYSYQWLYNGSPIGGATGSNYGASSKGTYKVIITSNAGCSVTSQSVYVDNFPLPNPSIIAYGNTLTTGTFVTYQWNENGIPLTGSSYTKNTIVAPYNGSYTVTVTDGNGCINTSSAYVVTTAGPNPTGVGTVSGNSNISIYPNPASTLVHIEAPYKVNITLSAIDGRELIHRDNAKEIDITGLANGVYMITVYNSADNTVVKVDRLVKNSN
jgi:hypothetical protein